MAYGVGQLTPKQNLGISGFESGEYIAASVVQEVERLAKAGITTLEQLVANTFPDLDNNGIAEITRALRAEQNNRLGVDQLRNPTPPITQQEEFDENYQRDLRAAEATQARLSKEQFASLREVMEAQAKNDAAKLERTLAAFKNPAIFGNIKSSYATDIAANARELEIANRELRDFAKGVNSADAAIARAEIVLRDTLFNILKTNLPNELDADILKLVDGIVKAGRVQASNDPQMKGTQAMIMAALHGYNKYIEQARNNIGPANAAAQGQAINQAMAQTFDKNNLVTNRANKLSEAFQKLSSIIDQSASDVYSFAQAQQKAALFVQTELAKILSTQKGPIS